MLLNILAVGDVVSQSGVTCLRRHLPTLKRLNQVHFTVVNGENAAGVGLTEDNALDIFTAGADVITLGNHTWGKIKITQFLEDNRYILRPANFPQRLPGRGWAVYEGPMGLRIGVVNLIGRVEMDPNVDNPFTVADSVLAKMDADIVLADFHAEATSEKLAMGWYLDGRVSALWGTHTHVPTADNRVLPKGAGYVTDLGMTGPRNSVIGIQPQISINKFLGGLPRRYEPAPGPCQLNAVLFTVDSDKRTCLRAERIDITD
ncbi:MAG: TIGR00282 family metallophosphoesterase [Clostridiales bacterium]|nr:TIGR00282 family metallophosphoesterase [Clostridiales bacterium]